jgi:hypothetical protein
MTTSHRPQLVERGDVGVDLVTVFEHRQLVERLLVRRPRRGARRGDAAHLVDGRHGAVRPLATSRRPMSSRWLVGDVADLASCSAAQRGSRGGRRDEAAEQ